MDKQPSKREWGGSLEGKKPLDLGSIEEYKKELHESIIGQDDAVESMAELYASLTSGVKRSRLGPLAVQYLAGPSGVGKTESVYALAKMFLDRNKEIQKEENINKDSKTLAQKLVMKVNGGEFQHSHEVAKLLGSPPGYLGHRETPSFFSEYSLDNNRIIFTDKLGNKRHLTIILMDEAEKMHDNIQLAMLGILDKGTLVTGTNETVNFDDTVIFYTSNVGNRQIENYLKGANVGYVKNADIDISTKRTVIEDKYKEAFIKAFPPEFRGRIHEVIVFEHLSHEQVKEITSLILLEFEQDLSKSGIPGVELQVTPGALDLLISKGYDTSEGARKMRKVMESLIFKKLLRFPPEKITNTILVANINDGGSGLDFYEISKKKKVSSAE